MKVIEWSINRPSEKRFKTQMKAIAELNPDILVLVEYDKQAGGSPADTLAELGLSHFVFSQDLLQPVDHSQSGVLVASRWPVTLVKNYPDLPNPDRVVTVSVDSPDGAVEVTAINAPVGGSTGYKKIATAQAVYEHLAVEFEGHRLLSGDFSSPKVENADGTIDVFGSSKTEGGDWAEAERSILRGLAEFGMVDSYRTLHGFEVDAWSCQRIRKKKVQWQRRYDHLFASESLKATSAEYLHDLDGLSNHTPLEVVFG